LVKNTKNIGNKSIDSQVEEEVREENLMVLKKDKEILELQKLDKKKQ